MQTTTKNPLTALTLAITLGVWVHASPVSATGIAATHSATWNTEQQQIRHTDEARQHLEKAKNLLMELKSEITAEGNNRSATHPLPGLTKEMTEEMKIPDPIRQKLQISIPMSSVTSTNRPSRPSRPQVSNSSTIDMPVAITLGKVQSALRSLFTKDTLLVNAVDKDPSGKTCRTTYRSQVHRQGHFDGVLIRSPIA